MVDDSGRIDSRRGSRRNSSTESSTKGWLRVIGVCCCVSIAVQIILPAAQEGFSLWLRGGKKKPRDLAVRFEKEQPIQAAFLEEPFPVERWKGQSADLIRRDPAWVQDETSEARDAEAIAAVSAARQARENGNQRKCKMIMEHALALSPNHPDVLTEYGFYLETVDKDVVSADSFYTKALAYDPGHFMALASRERTRGVVSELDELELANLRKKRDELSSLPHSAIIRREMRESYFSLIYHTVAIEGNTLSLGQTRSVLETGMPIPGKSLVEHNEVLGMDSALRFLNRSLIHSHEITLEDILEIHRHVLGHVAPTDAGRLRSTQVYVGRFTPVAPSEVASQMEELIEWLNDERTIQMEPVERAAIAHYKLVLTHPFVDGNGRTARLLMNVVLMRSGFPPVILPVEEKAEYYATLNTANLGDLRPFVRFVAKHTRITLQKYIDLGSTCSSIECSSPTATKAEGPTEAETPRRIPQG